MTRREVAEWLAALFDPFGIPVAPSPLDPAKPPCLILEPGNGYRQRTTGCWTQALTLTAVGGRMDDVDVYDRLDELADTVCRVVTGNPQLVNAGASAPPAAQQIGDVDYLTVSFDLTAYNIGPGLTI